MKPSCVFIQEAGQEPRWPTKPQVMSRGHYKCLLWVIVDGVKDTVEIFTRPTKKHKRKTMTYREFNDKHLAPAISELMPEGSEFESWGFSVWPWN